MDAAGVIPPPATSPAAGLVRLSCLSNLSGRTTGRADRHEVVVGDRILVFLAEIMTLHERVDGRRQVLRVFAWYKSDRAELYCSPRNTSSSSFSRCASCRQTGMTIDISTVSTATITRSAAIA